MEPDRRVCHHYDLTGSADAGHRDIDDRRDPREGAQDGVEPSGQKRGARASDRAHERRIELETTRLRGCDGPSDPDVPISGQTSDYIGPRALLASIPPAAAPLGDRDCDADWFRDALIDMGISLCIPSRRSRKEAIPHDADLYRQREKIENMFARLKDWRRISTRYDRCPILFLSACALAATVIYWL